MKSCLCKFCKFWDTESIPANRMRGRGMCTNKKIKNALKMEYQHKDNYDYFVWYCGSMEIPEEEIGLFTGGNFGCVHWEEKEEKS